MTYKFPQLCSEIAPSQKAIKIYPAGLLISSSFEIVSNLLNMLNYLLKY